jgi:hypothetical protein
MGLGLSAQRKKRVVVHAARSDLRLSKRRSSPAIVHMLAFPIVQPLLERLYTI